MNDQREPEGGRQKYWWNPRLSPTLLDGANVVLVLLSLALANVSILNNIRDNKAPFDLTTTLSVSVAVAAFIVFIGQEYKGIGEFRRFSLFIGMLLIGLSPIWFAILRLKIGI